MANKILYVVEYRMPIAFDNPPVNIPTANKPELIRLTEDQATQLKSMLPDVTLVKAKDQDADINSTSPQAQMAGQHADESPDEEVEVPSESEEPLEDESEAEKSEEEEAEEAEEEDEEAEPSTETVTELDEDFPAADKLKEAGLNTVEDVIQFSLEHNLDDIDGIGSARSDKIEDYLKENYADLID